MWVHSRVMKDGLVQGLIRVPSPLAVPSRTFLSSTRVTHTPPVPCVALVPRRRSHSAARTPISSALGVGPTVGPRLSTALARCALPPALPRASNRRPARRWHPHSPPHPRVRCPTICRHTPPPRHSAAPDQIFADSPNKKFQETPRSSRFMLTLAARRYGASRLPVPRAQHAHPTAPLHSCPLAARTAPHTRPSHAAQPAGTRARAPIVAVRLLCA